MISERATRNETGIGMVSRCGGQRTTIAANETSVSALIKPLPCRLNLPTSEERF